MNGYGFKSFASVDSPSENTKYDNLLKIVQDNHTILEIIQEFLEIDNNYQSTNLYFKDMNCVKILNMYRIITDIKTFFNHFYDKSFNNNSILINHDEKMNNAIEVFIKNIRDILISMQCDIHQNYLTEMGNNDE